MKHEKPLIAELYNIIENVRVVSLEVSEQVLCFHYNVILHSDTKAVKEVTEGFWCILAYE